MKYFLFAGGESQRMYPYNSLTDKSLLWLPDGTPVIRKIVDRLNHTLNIIGPQIVILCLDKHIPHFKHEFRDSNIEIFPKPTSIGTLAHFYDAVREYPDTQYMIHYADQVTDLDYKKVIDHHNSHNADGTIVTVSADNEYGEVVVNTETGMVEYFTEKPPLPRPIWTGIAIVEKSAIDKVIDSGKIDDPIKKPDIGYHFLPRLTQVGELMSYHHPGKWFDCGSVNGLRKIK